MTDLKDTAKSLVADLIREGDQLDLDQLRDDIGEHAFTAAENACTYYPWCEEIISRYESDPRADTDSCDDMSTAFKASDYRQAMAAYAFGIARSIIEAEACELVSELEEARDHLALALATVGPTPPSSDFRLSADCPHGWAAHDREDDHGACFWVSRQLDDCNAVAVPAAGVWLSYTWEG
jgi:hypothetical protein